MKKSLVSRMAVLSAIAFALALVAMPAASSAEPQKAEFMIVNNSDWDIHELYLSPTHKESWGPDQLGDKIIQHGGGKFTLHGIPCGHYDIKVVDDDGDACIIEDVIMCKDHTHWDITDKELAKCEGWGD